MKRFLIAILATVGVISCGKINEQFENINTRLDNLENTTIASINQQIASINTSIGDLEETDTELKGYITNLQNTATELQRSLNTTNEKIDRVERELKADLASTKDNLSAEILAAKTELLNNLMALRTEMQGKLDQINIAIGNLQSADVNLGLRIDQLKNYTDSEIRNTKDWASATFSTLEQYNQTVTEIAGIKANITAINTAMGELETRINNKIANDIAQAVSTLEGELQQQAADITQAYKDAIATAKGEIESAYTQAIRTAISNSESSMQSWVNDKLTGYYTIAQTDAKLATLKETLESDLATQKQYLEGKISTLETSLTGKIEANGALISGLQMQLSGLSSDLATLAETVAANSRNISQNAADIAANARGIATNASDIEACEQLIAANKRLIEDNATAIGNNAAAITALQGRATTNEQNIATNASNIGKNASDIAANAELIATNAEAITNNSRAISTNATNIANLQSSLATAITDITTAYTTAISSAITENNGVINAKIASDIATAQAALQQQIDAITTRISNLESRVGSIEETIADILNTVQDIVVIPTYSDGSVACIGGDNDYFFEVLPSGAASRLAAAGKDIFTMKAVYTQTKSAVSFVTMPISSVRADGDILIITASGSNLSPSFFAGDVSASASLIINSGSISRNTGYFPLFSPLSSVALVAISSNLTSVSVVLNGNISGTNKMSEYGICYSKDSPLCNNVVKATNMDSAGDYSVSLTGLIPQSKYYFKAYCLIDEDVLYSSIQSVETPSLSTYIQTVSSSDVTMYSASLTGFISPEVASDSSVQFGFCLSSETDSPSKDDRVQMIHDTDVQGAFQASIRGLMPETTYYFRVFASASGQYDYGEVMSFRTLQYEVEEDLSKNGTANSYIVPKSGRYKFKGTVKGNSNISLDGVPTKADVLWESFGTSVTPSINDVISGVSFSNGYVFFETPSELRNGNAVIAVRDVNDVILWSWHIWICKDYNADATCHLYYNNAGLAMDRNLGALSSSPGDVGALGLMYQWGRKDPFLGASGIIQGANNSIEPIASTLSWPPCVMSSPESGTVSYTIAHPTTQITYITNGTVNFDTYSLDWLYSADGSSPDNTRWQSSKTIYDPCPPGWKVPDGGTNGLWSMAAGSNSTSSYRFNSTKKGIDFSQLFGSAASIWYPASGLLDGGDGKLYGVGYNCRLWACTTTDKYGDCMLFHYTNEIYLSSSCHRSTGLPVRCVLE